MEKHIKLIILGIIILAILGALIYLSFDVTGPGSLIGGIALLWAGIKSKIFGSKTIDEKIIQLKEEHQLKRDEWEKVREEYDSQFRALQAQMMYLDYKSALISEKLNHLDEYEKQRLSEIDQANSDDLLNLLNNHFKK